MTTFFTGCGWLMVGFLLCELSHEVFPNIREWLP
jgi:hypothetical protein